MRHAAPAFLLAAALLSTAHAADLTPEDAKALADKSEHSLNTLQYNSLLDAQGAIARAAFPSCAERLGNDPPGRFTIVVELNAAGHVTKSWAIDDAPFAQCFRREMELRFLFRPPEAPFYSSFSYTRTKKE